MDAVFSATMRYVTQLMSAQNVIENVTEATQGNCSGWLGGRLSSDANVA
jgi:hypothetical protein